MSMSTELRWRYCIERPRADNIKGDPNGPWVYTDVYDTESEALAAVKAVTGAVRVKRFAVPYFPPDYGITPSVYTSKPISGTDVDMVNYTCIDHDNRVVRAYGTARAPRCPDCRSTMVTMQFYNAVKSLSNR